MEVMNAEGMLKLEVNHLKSGRYSNPRPRYRAGEFTGWTYKMLRNSLTLPEFWISASLCLYVFYLLKTYKKIWEQGLEYHKISTLTVFNVHLQWHCLKPKYRADLDIVLVPHAKHSFHWVRWWQCAPNSPQLPHSFRSCHRGKAMLLYASQGEYCYLWWSSSMGSIPGCWAGTWLPCYWKDPSWKWQAYLSGLASSPWVSQQWQHCTGRG